MSIDASPEVPPPAVEPGRGRLRALAALALLVPAPSLGTMALLDVWPGLAGKVVYGLSKAWILGLPVVWLLLVERGRVRISRPPPRGMLAGAAWGLVIGAAIFGTYHLAAGWIDLDVFKRELTEAGFANPMFYLGSALYIVLCNAVLEEYVWRWFVYQQCERLMPGGVAVVASALFFTVHHIVALRDYTGWDVTLLACSGVFLGGVIWSGLYRKYRSIWPGWASHIVADVAVYVIGWRLLFGGGG